ncbi:N-6 DNA methylase [Methanolobus sp. WCC5]|uniref:N-6 DNA methylase n=1 Tax=Methanolobus sp. WCC5 TaxID=3125785 RepID=UPI0032484628
MTETKSLETKIMNVYSKMKSASAGKSKEFIIPLYFMKRMSDSFEEAAERIFQETGDYGKAWNMPEYHNFYVPEVARWATLQKVNHSLGSALSEAFEGLGEFNENLKDALESYCQDAEVLNVDRELEAGVFHIIQSLSDIPLRDGDLADPEDAVRMFERIIYKLALDEKRALEGYAIPQSLAHVMVALLEADDEMTVCDPACGTGSLLVECNEYLKARDREGVLKLYGQEVNRNSWRISKLALAISGSLNPTIKLGDAITEPGFVENGNLMQFDRVISVPPFSKKDWGYEVAKKDPFGRFRYGVPPKGTGDFAYLQHMIANLNGKGKLVTVAPAGILFRGGSEGSIRKGITQSDLIEAVIALPTGLFSHTAIPTYIIVINMEKPAERTKSVLFIAADQEFQQDRRDNSYRHENAAKIVSSFKEYSDIEKYCRVVPISEIAENEFNLSMPLYVDTSPEIETVDIESAVKDILEIEGQRKKVRDELFKSLNKIRGFE